MCASGASSTTPRRWSRRRAPRASTWSASGSDLRSHAITEAFAADLRRPPRALAAVARMPVTRRATCATRAPPAGAPLARHCVFDGRGRRRAPGGGISSRCTYEYAPRRRSRARPQATSPPLDPEEVGRLASGRVTTREVEVLCELHGTTRGSRALRARRSSGKCGRGRVLTGNLWERGVGRLRVPSGSAGVRARSAANPAAVGSFDPSRREPDRPACSCHACRCAPLRGSGRAGARGRVRSSSAATTQQKPVPMLNTSCISATGIAADSAIRSKTGCGGQRVRRSRSRRRSFSLRQVQQPVSGDVREAVHRGSRSRAASRAART